MKHKASFCKYERTYLDRDLALDVEHLLVTIVVVVLLLDIPLDLLSLGLSLLLPLRLTLEALSTGTGGLVSRHLELLGN